MKGGGSNAPNRPNEKWLRINQLVREHKIAVLAVQETHLTTEAVDSLNELFSARLQIYYSAPPDRMSASKGVAFVVNKERLYTESITATEIIAGRAQLIRLTWHRAVVLTVLNVYAPNQPNENAEFWNYLSEYWDLHQPGALDVIMGDFNLVENAIDRLPAHGDHSAAVTALQDFYSRFNLLDGWRETFPDTRAYTFAQPNAGSQSRLDRIYMLPATINLTIDWSIVPIAAFSTDHSMVSATLTNRSLPFVGPGRWVMPKCVILDKDLLSSVKRRGMTLMDALLTRARTQTENPQALYATFKKEIVALARKRAREKIPKIERTISKLKTNLNDILNTESDVATKLVASADIKSRIQHLERLRFNASRRTVAANDWMHGETIGRPWIAINKPKRPRDVMMSMRVPLSGLPLDHRDYDPTNVNPPRYTSKTRDMAALAGEYHANIQQDETGIPGPEVREARIVEALSSINATLNTHDLEYLDKPLTGEEINVALNSSKNGKATGTDGIPYEFWKELLHLFLRDTKANRPGFDIMGMFEILYDDIRVHGMTPGSDFADGWICPLYKKGDRREIANHRPITLLNTDYKLLTKTISTRLAAVVGTLIHSDQAGFIPHRTIFDQTNLVRLMPEYAEAVEENGVIIALDQEKAYDKIAHDYLWRVLEKFGLPESLVTMIRSLYTHARSSAVINGVFSKSFPVTRGVRQGDPLSCAKSDWHMDR